MERTISCFAYDILDLDVLFRLFFECKVSYLHIYGKKGADPEISVPQFWKGGGIFVLEDVSLHLSKNVLNKLGVAGGGGI